LQVAVVAVMVSMAYLTVAVVAAVGILFQVVKQLGEAVFHKRPFQ
jgi:hypothetical protein